MWIVIGLCTLVVGLSIWMAVRGKTFGSIVNPHDYPRDIYLDDKWWR